MFIYVALLLFISAGLAAAGVDQDHVPDQVPGAEADSESRGLRMLVPADLPVPTPSPNSQPPAPSPSNFTSGLEASTTALSPSQCIPPGCIPGVPLTRRPTLRPTRPPTGPPAPLPVRGDVTCKYGDVDCNVCANDVEWTFQRAFGTPGMDSKSWKWHLYWNNKYKPAGAGVAAGGLGSDLVYNHIQGFVRTNNDTIRYAASHSNSPGSRGGYFFVEKTSTRNQLHSMHLAETRHPNSVAEIGQYVVSSGDGTDGASENVRFFDLRKIRDSQNVIRNVPGLDTGGGLGMARMADGSHLLVANTNSGQSTKYLQMYRWVGPLTKPTSVKLLASLPYKQPSSWSGNYQNSDNLSLITECGTGRLYTIHASGDDRIPSVTDGYWRLSRVDWDATTGKPVHKTLYGRGVSQDKRNCHLRSSGTVHVTRDHKLEFYCHERNIIENLVLSHDWFDFTLKQPY